MYLAVTQQIGKLEDSKFMRPIRLLTYLLCLFTISAGLGLLIAASTVLSRLNRMAQGPSDGSEGKECRVMREGVRE